MQAISIGAGAMAGAFLEIAGVMVTQTAVIIEMMKKAVVSLFAVTGPELSYAPTYVIDSL